MDTRKLIEGNSNTQFITSVILAERGVTGGGGQSAGAMELLSISLKDAHEFFEKRNFDIQKEIPNFDQNFKLAQKIVRIGRTQRKDMPVINDDDVKKFQRRLEQGFIDIRAPFADETPNDNPFPEGLKGTRAQEFLQKGLAKYDGSDRDDKVNVQIRSVEAKKLKPIQKQIYFDKSMGATVDFGVQSSINFITKESFFIISADNYIIDGHHRFLSGLLIDPSIKVNCLSIDLDIKKLLPLAKAYGDAIGNKRNQ